MNNFQKLIIVAGFTATASLFAPVQAGAISSAHTGAVNPATHVAAGVNPAKEAMTGVNKTGGSSTKDNAFESLLTTVVNVLLFIIGAIAVIMIIIGGIRYVTSNGDQGTLKAAKDTILYAVVGLIVAIAAYAIVKWVISSFAT